MGEPRIMQSVATTDLAIRGAQQRVGTDVIGVWSNRFAEGQAAVTRRKIGKGQVVYLGTYLTDALVPRLFDDLLTKAGAKPILSDLPPGVEVSERLGTDQSLIFVMNTGDEPVIVPSFPEGELLVNDGALSVGALHLPGYGCAVLRQHR